MSRPIRSAANLERARLVDGPGEDQAAGVFSTGIDSPVMRDSSTKEWPREHHAVDRNAAAGRDQYRIADLQVRRRRYRADRAGAANGTSRGRNSSRSRIAFRPRPTVRPSSTSATSTNRVMTSAVKNSPMAAPATMAMVIDSSIVMRRLMMFSTASLKIGQPPISEADDADDADRRKRLPDPEPHGRSHDGHKGNTGGFEPLEKDRGHARDRHHP